MAPHRRIDVVLDSVRRLLRIGATANLFNLLQKQHPADLAAVYGELQERDRKAAFAVVVERSPKLAMESAAELGPEMAAQLLADRPAEEIAKLIQEIPSDDAAALVDYLPEELSTAVLELMRPKESGQVGNLLEFPEKTAGRIMNPNVFALSEDLTVGEGISQLQSSRDVEMVFYLYIVDARRHLVGVTSLRRLLLVSPETPLKRIMTPDVISVRVDTDQEEAARLVASYNLLAIPGRRRGEQAGRRHHRRRRHRRHQGRGDRRHLSAGRRHLGRARVSTPPGESLTKRLPWLAVNLVTAFIAASVVSLFEHTIDQVVALAVFMPIVAGMGGNAGTQTLTVIVRGIALGELNWGNTRKALFKEALVGLGNGLVLGTMGALVVWLMKGNPVLGGVLGLAMVINMFIAAHGRNADSAGIARDEGRSGAGQLGVHHDVHRCGRVRLVSGAGDGVPEVPQDRVK